MSSSNNNGSNPGLGVRGYDTTDRERSPLLGSRSSADYRALQDSQLAEEKKERTRKGVLAGCLTLLFILAFVLCWTFFSSSLPSDPLRAANAILDRAPIIVSTRY